MKGATTGEALSRYYAWHAPAYDLTRWAFLFGRRAMLAECSAAGRPSMILEIGCGTGTNLQRLAELHPGARLVGIDLSSAMLDVARRRLAGVGGRIELRQGCYRSPVGWDPAPDLIVISYCLSMVNPGWEGVVAAAVEDLAPGGVLGVVDFHGSRRAWFRRWMRWNHVRMEEHLAPGLAGVLPEHTLRVHRALGGFWRYFVFVGRKSRSD